MEWMETEQAYNNNWYLKGYAPKEPDPEPKTREEVRQTRETLYKEKVDPITSHIHRLKDEEQTEYIKEEIEQLKQERKRIFIEIQRDNPYPAGE